MSKSLKNYPDPSLVIDKYGADALRLYLINSLSVVKDVFLPWYNAYRFFVQNAERLQLDTGKPFDRAAAKDHAAASTNVMDRWVLALLNNLIKFVSEEMAAYRLYTVVPKLVLFIEQLTNWYVRLNRTRLKGASGSGEEMKQDTTTALSTLYQTLLMLCRLMAPFTPFFAEFQYQRLALPTNEADASVHYLMVPEFDPDALDPDIEKKTKWMQTVVGLGRLARERRNISLKKPVQELIVVHRDQAILDGLSEMRSYVKSELNIHTLTFTTDEKSWCTLRAEPENKVLGRRLGKAFGGVKKAIAKLTHEQCVEFQANGELKNVGGHVLSTGDLRLVREFNGDAEKYENAVSTDGSLLIALDLAQSDELLAEGLAREVVNRVQKLRKSAKLQVSDVVDIYYEVNPATETGILGTGAKPDPRQAETQAKALRGAIEKNAEGLMAEILRCKPLPIEQRSPHALVAAQSDELIDSACVKLTLTCPCVKFAESVDSNLQLMMASMSLEELRQRFTENNGSIKLTIQGNEAVTIKLNEDVFLPDVAK